METGLILAGLGLILLITAYLTYCRQSWRLRKTKEEDLVAYYLELAINLVPVPFWVAVIGLVFLFAGIISILLKWF